MATADRVSAAIGAAKLGDEGTKYAPALKLASQIISASTLPQREVVVVSDFQKNAWANHNEIVFPARHEHYTDRRRRRGSVGRRRHAARDRPRQQRRSRPRDAWRRGSSTRERPRGPSPRRCRSAAATVQTQHVNVPASGALQVAFTSIPVPNAPTKASISITHDSLPQTTGVQLHARAGRSRVRAGGSAVEGGRARTRAST